MKTRKRLSGVLYEVGAVCRQCPFFHLWSSIGE